MTAYQLKPSHAFKQRVTDSKGNTGIFSTGTADVATKNRVVAMLKRLKGQRRWDVLDAIVSKRVKLKEVFDAYEVEQLDDFMGRALEADLDSLLTEWAETGANTKYVTQVRRLILEGVRFPASQFTRKAISAHLGKLRDARASASQKSASNSTKNRHRAALSQFGKWLVEREVIASNPVRDVAGKTENPARMVSYDWNQARAVIDALPEPYRAMEALMASTGMEWSAVAALRRSDVDLDARKVNAKGTKNRHRTRVVRVTEVWAWEIFEKHVRKFMPAKVLFDLEPKTALATHRKAVEAAGLQDSTLHDWRHTYAVNKLREGMRPAVVRHQLGHAKNSTEVERIYGLHEITDADFDTRTATTNATTPEKQREA